MKYVSPLGTSDPDAVYTDPVDGTIPAAAIEQPMREIVNVIAGMGLVPGETDLTQLDQAIDLKVAAMQPDLTEFVSRHELCAQEERFTRRMDELIRKMERLVASEKYDLCEFYYFRNPVLRPGFLPARGELAENAADLYPDAWNFLQTTEGQGLCVTEEEWQAMSRATWATLADGTNIGWNGTGGVPFYSPDLTTGSLRLPDLRGMYAEAAGFDGLETGGAHGDAMRNIAGQLALHRYMGHNLPEMHTGPFSVRDLQTNVTGWDDPAPGYSTVDFNPARIVPTANKNQPRAWGALACVYLGRPRA